MIIGKQKLTLRGADVHGTDLRNGREYYSVVIIEGRDEAALEKAIREEFSFLGYDINKIEWREQVEINLDIERLYYKHIQKSDAPAVERALKEAEAQAKTEETEPKKRGKTRWKQEEVVAFIKEIFGDNKVVSSRKARERIKAAGIPDSTSCRARAALGIETGRNGKSHFWRLP
jgi:hypothetical protein